MIVVVGYISAKVGLARGMGRASLVRKRYPANLAVGAWLIRPFGEAGLVHGETIDAAADKRRPAV